MKDVKSQMLGVTTRPIVGERNPPTVEDLIPSGNQYIAVESCVRCGWKIDLTLEDLNELVARVGLPEQSEESIAGKFLQRASCPFCAGKEDEDEFQLLDIPRSS